MSDRLYLSCRLRGFNDTNALRHFEKLLNLFPSSKLAKRGPVLRVNAVALSEPPVVEREFELAATSADVIGIAREFFHPDCSAEIDSAWDLWQFDGEWTLRPAAVTLACFGSEFEDAVLEGGVKDHLRIEFGLDSNFLPDDGLEGSLHMRQSNLRSLLHLTSDVDRILPVETRQLWSEGGENFAGLLTETLERFSES